MLETQKEMIESTFKWYGSIMYHLGMSHNLLDVYKNSLLYNEERKKEICSMIENHIDNLKDDKEKCLKQLEELLSDAIIIK